MAIQVNRIGVDEYTLQIDDGGTINLLTGLAGKVNINGNVDIAGSMTAGSSTNIESEDLLIYDNTFTLNKGETGPGISALSGTAGMIIERGTRDDVRLFFDENKNSIRSGGSITGAFIFQDATANVSTDALLSIYSGGVLTGGEDLYLVGTGDGVVKVTGTVDYETRIWDYAGDGAVIPEDGSRPDRLRIKPGSYDDDILVNVRGLTDYIASYNLYNFQDTISASTFIDPTTFVTAEHVDAGDGQSRVLVNVNGAEIAQFFENRLVVDTLRISDDTISSEDTDGFVKLQGTGDGVVQSNDFFNLTVQDDTSLGTVADGIYLYSKPEADGGTGLFFKNANDTQDEIISRNKALLFSIIF
tara:strand:- start:6292 stop:7365 length:1074 start_codon:yes stop_codon:yes gene_type:complete